MACEASAVYYLAFYRKKFAGPWIRVLRNTMELVSFLRCDDEFKWWGYGCSVYYFFSGSSMF